MSQIKRALVSVTNKDGIVAFVKALVEEFGVEIVSTGGTANVLVEAGIPVIPIEDYTSFPEMMGGRVKTLHPRVHGGLLCRRDDPEHMAEAKANGIDMIDMVVVNLYEFEKTVAKPSVTFDDAIEHIDIGGPSMLRSAAKNNDAVTVVCDPADYDTILNEMRSQAGATSLQTRRQLAYKVFSLTAAYDTAIAQYLDSVLTTNTGEASSPALSTSTLPSQGSVIQRDRSEADIQIESPTDPYPQVLRVEVTKAQELRYGENPQQHAAFYRMSDAAAHSLANARQVQGKELSYNNFLDTDAAWAAVREFTEPACIILKHQNPCGSATASDITAAYDKAFACDPVSAFGGIIACNQEVPLELVEHFADINKQFVEVLIAPSYTEEALARLSRRKNLRVLATGGIDATTGMELRSVDGGLLVQDIDHVCEDVASFSVVSDRKPTDAEMDDLLFAWKVCKTVKSNAILIAKDRAGLGMGPGQPNRVDSARIACERAAAACERMELPVAQLVCASDAFFPFRDCVDELAARGVTAIIQPGGSVRDDESIAACNEHDIAMVFTGVRHFRH